MRVILVRPPSTLGVLRQTTSLHHPIGLALLAAVAEKAGHQAEIVDYEVMPYDLNFILKHDPDVVALTAMTPTIHSAYRIAVGLQEAGYKKPIVLGGVHATVLPKRSLIEAAGAIDAVVVGEGEKRFPQMLAVLQGKADYTEMDGVAWRDRDQIHLQPCRERLADLDEYPFPDRDKIRMELYDQTSSPGFSRRFLKITEIFTSRGCAHDCTFCVAALLAGRRVRYRSLALVEQEMKQCINRYSIEHFTICDDNFGASRRRVVEFCERTAPLNVTWTCESRVTTVDPELLTTMKRAGCRKISFGLEAASTAGLARVKKNIDAESIGNAFAWTRRAGIKRGAFFLVGSHPEETKEDIAAIEQLFLRIDPDYIVVSIATPYPGTELQRQMKEKNLVIDEDWAQYRAFTEKPRWRTVHFTPTQLVSMQHRLIRRFYLRPRIVWRHLRAVGSWREMCYLMSSLWALIRLIGARRE